MKLSDKLDDALFGLYPNREMREAVRKFREHKTMKEARQPLTGIYWWVPIRKGKKIEWVVQAYHDDIYKNPLHSDVWKHVLDFLKTKWKKLEITSELMDAYAGLPRGRISKTMKGYTHYHGGDAPGSLGSARGKFNLTLGGNNTEMLDEHEQMLDDDAKILQKALGVDLGLRGV